MLEARISGTLLLLNLIGAGALLLWGLRMVRTGVMRCWGGALRRRLGDSVRNRFSAFLAGAGVTLLLQSSTATALMTASFAGRGLVTTAAALAIMLGADVGTGILAQLFSMRIEWLAPVLIAGGVILFLAARRTQPRDLGRTIVGIGIIMLALRLVGEAAAPLRESSALPLVLGALDSEPLLAVLLAAGLTVLSTSSLAVVLFIVTMVAGGVVHPSLGLALVLGANLGSGVTPLLASLGSGPEARRVPLGNLLFRLAGVAATLPFIQEITPLIASLDATPWRQVVDFHLAFNVALAAAFIGLTGPVARLCDKLQPSRPTPEDPGKARYLAEAEIPAVAIANAARETLRMGDMVEQMLRQSLQVFRTDDRNLLREVERLDDAVDTLHESIKLYLTDLMREGFGKSDNKQLIEVLTVTTNLEHIGDIIDKNLMELAAKKIRHRLRFSDEGFGEITAMHARLLDNLRLALNLFISRDVKMARRLLREKVILRDMERAAFENHLHRLRRGLRETLETSSLHLDVLRDLKRINSHLTSVAYPILDDAGELIRSRLKEVEPPPEPEDQAPSSTERRTAGSA